MLRKFLILLMAAFSSTFALRRVERRSSSESEEMNMFHDIIREQLASIYQDLYPMEETVSPSLEIIKVGNLTKEGASSRWSPSQYCHMRNSDQMIIGNDCLILRKMGQKMAPCYGMMIISMVGFVE